MSSFPEKVQQGEERKREPITGLQSFEDDLPPAFSRPRDKIILRGHDRSFMSAVAITESGLIATATEFDSYLCIFALDGDGEPLRVCSVPGMDAITFPALAALGGDVIAVGVENSITTWCASFGALLDISRLAQSGYFGSVTAMATLGPGQFVVGTMAGALVFFSHRDGRDLHEAGRGNKSHENEIIDIAVRGDTIVTAAIDEPAAVWSASTRVRVAVLGGHNHPVQCAAVCARFIATGSRDGETRLYEVGAGHAFVRMIMGTQNHWIEHVSFVAEDALMYVGSGSVTFTLLSSAKPVARLDGGGDLRSASITPDARIVCTGWHEVFICSLPAPVATAVKNHAATLFPSSKSPTFAEEELLQAAMVEVLAGSRSAGDACRALVSKENCSRSIEEWASAHRLLMSAVERNEIPGQLHFEGANSSWSENLYMPSSYLELYEDDRSLVERFAREAERAGVISKAEAVLAAVLGRQDVLKNEPRLLVSSRPFASPSVSPPPKVILAQSRPGVTSIPERSSVTSMPKQPGAEPMPRTVLPSVLPPKSILAQSRPGVTSIPERSSVTSMPKQPGAEPMPRTVLPSVLPPKRILARSRPGVTSMPERSSVTSMPKQPGVEPMPRTVHPSVLGGQDVSLKIVSKLHISGQKIASILWEVTARLAENDSEMRKLLTEVKSVDRHQKLSSLFNCVLSFELLGGNALAQGIAGADPVWSLLESIMSAGVVNQEGIAPTILDTFVGCAASLISPAGGSVLAAEDQVMFEKAVGALDISWEEFCGTIQKAAARRAVCTDVSGGQPWSDQELASVCRQVVGDDFPFLLSELRTVCSSNNSRSASGERDWPFQSLFNERRVSLMRWEAAPEGCEAVPEPDWLKAEQVDFGFLVQSNSGVEYFLFFKLNFLTEFGLKLFLSLVLPCEKSLAMLRLIGSEHKNCLLIELNVPFAPNGTHVELAVNAGWLEYVSDQRHFVENHVLGCDKELLVVGLEWRKTGTASAVSKFCKKLMKKMVSPRRLVDVGGDRTVRNLEDVISKNTDESADIPDPISSFLRMCDGSYFYVPECTPSQEMPSEYPKLIFPPKKRIVVAGGKGEKATTIGLKEKAHAESKYIRAIDFVFRENFNQQAYLEKSYTCLIVNLAQLNYLFPAPKVRGVPELDERVRVFSRALSHNGGFNVNPEEVSSCWYRAITGPPYSNQLSYFQFKGEHAVKVENLNYIDYAISTIDEARRYAEQEKRTDALALLRKAGTHDAHVVFVYSNPSDSSTAALITTRLAFFLGPNIRGGVRCSPVENLDPSQADGSQAFPEFRPPRCDAFGEIGGTRPLSVSSIGGSALSQSFQLLGASHRLDHELV